MNAKQLVVLAVITVVAIAVAMLLGGKGDGDSKPEGLLASGDSILGEIDVNSITRVVLREGEDTTTLEQKDGEWSVAEKGGYPADFNRIKRVITGLRDLKVSEMVEAGESVLGRFKLKPPESGADDEGKSVTLLAEGGEVVGSLVIGKEYSGAVTGEQSPMKQGSGNYVRVASKPGQVFITRGSFWDIQGAPSNWLQRQPFAITDPKSVEIAQPEGETFRFTREEKGGDVTMDGLAEDEELNTTNTGTLSAPFASVSFSDVVVGDGAKPEATGLGSPVIAKVSTFDGFNYTLKIGKVEVEKEVEEAADGEGSAAKETETKYYMTYEVDARFADARVPQDDEKVADDASDEDKKKAKDLVASRDKTFGDDKAKLAEKLEKEKARAGTVYVIDKWTAEKFFLGRDDLVKEKEKSAEGGGSPPRPPLPEAGIPGLPNTTIPGVVPTAPKPAVPPEEAEDSAPEAEDSSGDAPGTAGKGGAGDTPEAADEATEGVEEAPDGTEEAGASGETTPAAPADTEEGVEESGESAEADPPSEAVGGEEETSADGGEEGTTNP